MITRSPFRQTTFVLLTSLQLIIVVHSSSISPSASLPSSTSNASKQNVQSQSESQQQQQPQIQSTTALPTLLTTIVQDNLNYANLIKQQQQSTKQQQHHHYTEVTKQRSASNNDEHDPDMVPLATVNNHSRNQQAALRPPQYVDVSALIGVSIRHECAAEMIDLSANDNHYSVVLRIDELYDGLR